MPKEKSYLDRMVLILIIMSFAINIFIVLVVIPYVSDCYPQLYHINRMQDYYGNIAINLTKGLGYRIFSDTNITLFREPGYVLFLASLFYVFGGDPLIVSMLANIVLVLFSAFFLYKLCMLIDFDRSAAIGAVMVFCLHPGILGAESRASIEIFFLYLCVMSIYFACKAMVTTRLLYLIFSGAFFGISAITRNTVVIFIPIFCIYYSIKHLKNERIAIGVKSISCFLVAFSLIFSLFLIRNYLVSGRFIATATVAGDILFQGTYVARHFGGSGIDYCDVLDDAAREQTRILNEHNIPIQRGGYFQFHNSIIDEIEHCNLLTTIAINEYNDSLFLLLKSMSRNFLGLFVQGRTRKSTILNAGISIPFLLLFLWGLIICNRAKRRIGIIVLFIVTYIASHLPFLASFRHSIPIVPFMAIFCGASLSSLLNSLRCLFNTDFRDRFFSNMAERISRRMNSKNETP
jgi:hypothetical protein